MDFQLLLLTEVTDHRENAKIMYHVPQLTFLVIVVFEQHILRNIYGRYFNIKETGEERGRVMMI